MHPIEKFHKMVTAGNVLGPGGNWISRNEALKKKKAVLKHVFAGEVERNGRWVPVSDIQPSHTSRPAPQAQLPDDDVIHLDASTGSNISASVNPPASPAAAPTVIREPPPFIQVLHDHPGSSISDVTRKESDVVYGSAHTEPDTQPPARQETIELPPQPKIGSSAKESEPDADTIQRETITIRTVSLGKETSLTVSESRAGTALVAICSVQGFIDQSNADEFHAQLISMLDFGVRYFIIDFEHTTLVGSAGWGVLAVSARLVKASQGHLVICSMKDEIEESFLLLQFNEVIDSRKTISDCLDIIRSIIKNQETEKVDDGTVSPIFSQYRDDYNDLPLPEKLKTIIARNGPLSLFQISRHLKTERYGSITINPIKLYFLLKEMNLETRLKRTRYYRSC